MNTTTEVSLRERQKARRRSDILAAGRHLFNQKGFSATNMDAIAELSEVGVATVYNYFGTKGQLLAEILRSDFDLLFEQAKLILEKPPGNAIAGVQSLIDIYRKFQSNWQRKNLLLAVIGPGLSAERSLDELAIYAEDIVKKQLLALLSHYQQAEKIRANIDTNDAALIIFYMFNQHFIQYVSQEGEKFSEMEATMDRQIKFIVSAILH